MEANPIQTQEVSKLYLELMRATVTSGQSVLKAVMLINGGACIAILALLGQVLEKNVSLEALDIAKGITDALPYFAWGVVLSTLAAGSTYLTHLIQSMNPFKNWYYWITGGVAVSVSLVAGSVALFVCGAYTAKSAVTTHFEKKATQTVIKNPPRTASPVPNSEFK